MALSCAGLPLISELGSVTQYPASVMRARLERRRAIHSTPRRRQAWCARGRTVYTLVRNLPHTGVTITCHYHNYHRHHLVIIVTQYRVAMTPSLRANCEGTHASQPTWFKVRQRPVFWPSGRVPSTLRARKCSPTTAPSGAASGVPFFPHGSASAAVAPPKGRQLGAKCPHEGRRRVRTPSFSRTRPPKGDLCGTWSVHA